jgi:hypothetical protein
MPSSTGRAPRQSRRRRPGNGSRICSADERPGERRGWRAREAFGGELPGLIYTSDLTFPRTKAYVSRLVAALETAAASHGAARRGGVLWLRPLT